MTGPSSQYIHNVYSQESVLIQNRGIFLYSRSFFYWPVSQDLWVFHWSYPYTNISYSCDIWRLDNWMIFKSCTCGCWETSNCFYCFYSLPISWGICYLLRPYWPIRIHLLTSIWGRIVVYVFSWLLPNFGNSGSWYFDKIFIYS